MARQSQNIEAQLGKKNQLRTKPLQGVGPVNNSTRTAQLPNTGAKAGGTLETQTERLTDGRLQSAQHQALAAQIGQVQGNRHLQRVMASLSRNQSSQSGGKFIQASGQGISYKVDLSSPGPGQPLPERVRAKMEKALDADFSEVRIHTDDQAEQVGAHAFTSGSDLHFAPGRYNPESESGQKLLGHELTHVVQQRQGRVETAFQGSANTMVQNLELEAEADALGNRAAISSEVDSKSPQAEAAEPVSNHSAQQKPVVQGAIPAALTAIGKALTSATAVNASTVAGAVLAAGATAAAAGTAIMPGQTGVQEVQLENGWMSNTDKHKFELIIQYRLINAYVDHWISTHGGSTSSTGSAPDSKGSGEITEKEGEVDTTVLETVKTAVQLQIQEQLNEKQQEQFGSFEFIWSDSGDHSADWFGTVGAIEFVGLKGSYLMEVLSLKGAAAEIPNLNPAMKNELVVVRQFRGGRLVRGSEMETGINDDLGINLVGGGPTIDQAANEGHGVHTYDTAWNWDDNTTHWAFDVYIGALGTPYVKAQPSRGEPED